MAVIPLLLASACATTTSFIGEEVQIAEDAVFYVVQSDDPLNITTVIGEKLRKRGYGVRIVTSDFRFGEGQSAAMPHSSESSGFLVDPRGIILTCSHSISGANAIAVRAGDQDFTASILTNDPVNDLALLKVDVEERFAHCFSLAPASGLRIGEAVTVVGFPLSSMLGKDARVTDGIVSAKSGIDANPTRFQMTASIQPGNSGGPILNAEFEVLGVAVEILSDQYAVQRTGVIPQNVNFGVKIDYAKILMQGHVQQSDRATVLSLEDALKATVQVVSNPTESGSAIPAKSALVDVGIHYQYAYYWDAIHHVITSLRIDVVDLRTGEVIGQGTSTGDSLDGALTTVRGVMTEILEKIQG